MATTYEEEEKKPLVYGEGRPQQTYYGDDPNDASYAFWQQRIHEAANGIDPQRQAEQDARIQRGRNFWTGANLLGNVIANAINVNGTANGAPNMTFNDNAAQKMYDTWQQRDKELKADREKAQQRYDALMAQDAQMRATAQQQKVKDAQNVYDMNFKIQQAEAERERNLADKLAAEERAKKTWEEQNATRFAQDKELARIRHSYGGGGSSGSSRGSKQKSSERSTKYDTKVGGMTIMADNQTEKNFNMYSLATDMYEYFSSLSDDQKKAIFGDDYKNIKQPADNNFARMKFVKDNLNKFYNDPTFRAFADENYGDFIDFGSRPVVEPEQEQQQGYSLPTYQPRWGQGVYGSTKTQQQPAAQKARPADPYTKEIYEHAGEGKPVTKKQKAIKQFNDDWE